MNQEILDDPKKFPPNTPPSANVPKSILIQLAFAACSFILYFVGYSIYLSAELGMATIILCHFVLNYRSRPFGNNKPIAILRFLGANLILVGVFFQIMPYPSATLLQSTGLAILVLYFFAWMLWIDKQGYFFQFLKIIQGISVASFCWAIRSYMIGEAGYWFLISFLASIGTVLLLLVHYIRYKTIHVGLLSHLPLVIWVLVIQFTFICTKIF